MLMGHAYVTLLGIICIIRQAFRVVELHNVIYAAISTFVEKGFQVLH